MLPRSLKGRLLVASPVLTDPNFDRTVVLVLEHNDEGAIGVVLNRPSDTMLVETLPGWHSVAAAPGVVFVGGPVAPTAAIGLGVAASAPDSDGEGDGWTRVLGPLGTVDLGRDPDELQPVVREVRVFAGYAGWAAGQLEGELQVGGWFVVDADVGDALASNPGSLWRAVLKRQRGTLSWLANYPDDISTN
ncbi:MAG TPA: YqgE/AlgH family protein [Acidimicrobiia bacterium]|nr:YqgE/AlgH family protein [Acidimicrobiia bacterium]